MDMYGLTPYRSLFLNYFRSDVEVTIALVSVNILKRSFFRNRRNPGGWQGKIGFKWGQNRGEG